MIIARRAWQKCAGVSCRRLSPSSPASAARSSFLTAEKPEELNLRPVPRFFRSGSASFRFAGDCTEVKIPYFAMKCKNYSSHVAADLLEGGLVDVPLAQTGEGIAECELLKWFVQEGDQVDEFQPLCEVQSDKATIEITSRYKGRVAQTLYIPGDIVKVGETLLKMVLQEFPVPPQLDESIDTDQNKQNICGVLSTPVVRDLAKQYGVDINDVLGTGKDGRVLKDDVVNHAIAEGVLENSHVSSAKAAENEHHDKIVSLRGFQRKMVQSMSLAAKVPHFHYVDEINCDKLVELKRSFERNNINNNNNNNNVKYTFLPVLIKSLSVAMSKFPLLNSCFNEDSLEVILKGSHNIGVAMATQYGLVVPNIKNVQSLSIYEITNELSRLQKLASDNKLSPGDISGGTITLSNIGAIGGKFGSPLLNLPEVSIIAIGRIQKLPRFDEDGNIYPASIMTVNIGADHRVLDGATVARFCKEWKMLIENPDLLMLNLK